MSERSDETARPASTETLLAAVDRLAPVLLATKPEELEVESCDLVVRLGRQRVAAPAAAPSAPGLATAAVIPGSPFGEPAAGMRFVTAPLTGVWYGAPSPGAGAYVSAGDEITTGQVVGLIEAMKLFNEIKSDVAGTATRILVESGTLVKRQQPLLEIDPS
jgi:acetyl-CoA carboxylase biotin carboxyl carrier protein